MLERLFRFLQKFDWTLLLAVFALCILGFAAIYSVALSRDNGSLLTVYKQLTAAGIGVVFLLLFSNMHPLILRNWGRALYLGGVGLLLLVLFLGKEVAGTRGWFEIGTFSFQPVEVMKVALIVELARYFGEHARRRFGWREVLGSGFITAIPVLLTLRQPDTGSALLLVGIWAIVIFFAGIRWQQVSVLGGIGVCIAWIAWRFFLVDYQKARIQVFLNPALDPLRRGYNILQAKIAIGAGRWFGRGIGFGSQSQLKFLPASQTDFIFAVIAEELGFFGVTLVIGAFFFIGWRILRTARLSRDSFSAFLVIGIFAAIFCQAFVNIGVDLALLPATGVALPFVSYGGSSLLVSLAMIGMVESAYVHTKSRSDMVIAPTQEAA